MEYVDIAFRQLPGTARLRAVTTSAKCGFGFLKSVRLFMLIVRIAKQICQIDRTKEKGCVKTGAVAAAQRLKSKMVL